MNVTVGDSSGASGTGKAKSIAGGGATAKASAIGIAADSVPTESESDPDLTIDDNGATLGFTRTKIHASGDDELTNDAAIEARASAVTRSAGVGMTVNGPAKARSKATAETDAVAIDLGGGADTLVNTGQLTAVADSAAGQ